MATPRAKRLRGIQDATTPARTPGRARETRKASRAKARWAGVDSNS